MGEGRERREERGRRGKGRREVIGRREKGVEKKKWSGRHRKR